MSGKDITFDVNGQPSAGYLALPEQLNAPGVIVLHAWWGLNPFFKSFCDRLAKEGFVAFAPDLNGSKVAQTVDEAERLLEQGDREKKHAIVAAAPDFLRSRSDVQKERLAVIGFSMGAAQSLALASERAADIRKLVVFYGTNEVDFSKIQADILGHFADTDEYEPLDGIRGMETSMRAAGLKPAFYIYPNTLHWFFENDRPEYDPQAARRAWTRTLEFLRA